MRNRFLHLAMIVAALSLVLAACGPQPTEAPAPERPLKPLR
jgi:hypothetical protein